MQSAMIHPALIRVITLLSANKRMGLLSLYTNTIQIKHLESVKNPCSVPTNDVRLPICLETNTGDFLFKLGVFLVLVGASITGWGCSCPCGASVDYGTVVGPCSASVVPGGACYTRVAYVPLACCWSELSELKAKVKFF